MKFYEQQILTNSRLNDHEKCVLSTIIGKQNGKSTLVDVTAHIDQYNKQNITKAVENLQNLGLLNIDQNKTLQVSDRGYQQMEEENLVDGSKMLTPDGQKFQKMFSDSDPDEDQNDPNNQDVFGNAPLGGIPAPSPTLNDQAMPQNNIPPPMGESFVLIKEILNNIKFNEQLDKFKPI